MNLISIGEPQTVPAGKYALEVLTHFQLFEQLKPKLVLAKDVRQVLTYVITGNVDASIVYATDAKTSAEVSVAATAPEDSRSLVIYPVAVLKSSKEAGEAKRFLDFLTGDKRRKYSRSMDSSQRESRRTTSVFELQSATATFSPSEPVFCHAGGQA